MASRVALLGLAAASWTLLGCRHMDPVTAGVLTAVLINEAAYHSQPPVVYVEPPPPPAPRPPLPPTQERVISQRKTPSVAPGWHYRLGEITTSTLHADPIQVHAEAERYRVCVTKVEEVVEHFRVFPDGASQSLGTSPVEHGERQPCQHEPAVGIKLTVEGVGGKLLEAVSDAHGRIEGTIARADLLRLGPAFTARILGIAVRRAADQFDALFAAVSQEHGGAPARTRPR